MVFEEQTEALDWLISELQNVPAVSYVHHAPNGSGYIKMDRSAIYVVIPERLYSDSNGQHNTVAKEIAKKLREYYRRGGDVTVLTMTDSIILHLSGVRLGIDTLYRRDSTHK